MCAQNEENTKKIGHEELRGVGGGDPDKARPLEAKTAGQNDDRNEEADDLRKGDCGLTEVVVVKSPKKNSVPDTPTISDASSTTFVNEDQPLSKEEKKIHYKYSKNVMAGRKIRELMNANVRENFRLRMEQSQPKSFKICCVAGIAIAVQIIVLVLMFI